MRKLYALAMYLAIPVVLALLAWRGLKDRGYAQRWPERFAYYRKPPPIPGGLAIHAASVGEVNAAAPLIRAVLQHMPDLPLVVTTFTPTGSRRVSALFGQRTHHVYAPLDLPGSVRRFFHHFQPRLLIVLETEVWPNLFAQAKRRGVPILLVNARLSARSVRGYRHAQRLVGEALGQVAWFAAQSTADAQRLIECGAHAGRVEIVGNLKFDLAIPPTLPAEGRALRERWGEHRPVLVAGSSHAEDEDILLPAFAELRRCLPEALLILVPRHPERFREAAKKARAHGFKVALRSESEACPPATECFVVDAMGELMRYYAACDIAFVGGTFGKVGGHNLLEPAALGRPVLIGPHTRNTAEIAERLIEEGAAVRLHSQEELTAALINWFEDTAARSRAGDAAQRLVGSGRGALQRNLRAVRFFLDHG